MFGIAYVIVFDTERAAYILEGMAALSTIWAVGLSVLGVYIFKRSEDKKLFSSTFNFERPKLSAPPRPNRKPKTTHYNN